MVALCLPSSFYSVWDSNSWIDTAHTWGSSCLSQITGTLRVLRCTSQAAAQGAQTALTAVLRVLGCVLIGMIKFVSQVFLNTYKLTIEISHHNFTSCHFDTQITSLLNHNVLPLIPKAYVYLIMHSIFSPCIKVPKVLMISQHHAKVQEKILLRFGQSFNCEPLFFFFFLNNNEKNKVSFSKIHCTE